MSGSRAYNTQKVIFVLLEVGGSFHLWLVWLCNFSTKYNILLDMKYGHAKTLQRSLWRLEIARLILRSPMPLGVSRYENKVFRILLGGFIQLAKGRRLRF